MNNCELITAARRIVAEVRDLDPRTFEPGDAHELVSVWSELERLVSARRLEAASMLSKENCRERSPAVALARAGGITVGQANSELRRANLIRSVDEVQEAVFSGELSAYVGGIIAGAAKHNSTCIEELSRIAREESLEALQDEARRIARRAGDEETVRSREARAHAIRRCSFRPATNGGMRLDALLPSKDGVKVRAAIEKLAKSLSTESARADQHEEFTAHMADALCRLILDGGSRVETQVFVHASAGALHRGDVGPGECCEVEGLGEISLTLAREYMDEGLVTLLVEDAVDILAIARRGRYLTQNLIDALIARDRRCVVPGCGSTFRLEFHHYKIPFRKGGVASLENLCRLCGFHHALTEKGYSITGEPGAWEWHEP